MSFSPTIDVRCEAQFLAAHLPGSANISLEDLAVRVHELPRATEPVRIIDSDASRAAEAARFLSRRGHRVSVIPWEPSKLSETGPSRVRLWEPNPFLVEALGAIASGGAVAGRALDVACGSGRDAVYLALHGYHVEAIDLLPDALTRAQDLARRSGVAIATRVQDLEREAVLPANQYDLVCVFRYLQRNLFAALREAVRPGGYIVYQTFHERTRETGRKPQSPDHLLKTGELTRAFEGFDVLIGRDAEERDGRFFSSLLARRSSRSTCCPASS